MINSTGGIGVTDYSQMNQMRERMHERMFSRMDTDGDEKVSREEFVVFHENAPQGGKSAEEIFSEIDADGDGSISKSENEDAMKKMAREGKAERPRMSGPPPGGGAKGGAGASQAGETSESEDKNFNGIPDDEEDDEATAEASIENFIKDILKKYIDNNSLAGKTFSGNIKSESFFNGNDILA